MIFVSVAQATTRLGIDAKTLRRWLAEAQLPLQAHPQDGRKKGVNAENLHLLAHLHQRSLAPPLPASPALVPDGEPQVLAVLLALPERLDAFQAQLTAVQQQLTVLTRLREQQTHEPVSPPSLPQPTSRGRRPTASATSTSPRKPAQILPRVEYASDGHYVVICPTQGILPVEPDTQEWFAWLHIVSSFRFVGKLGHFTAHHEFLRVPHGAWRAHRNIRNHTRILRLATSQELTSAVLEQAAEALQALVN